MFERGIAKSKQNRKKAAMKTPGGRENELGKQRLLGGEENRFQRTTHLIRV